MVEGEQQYVSYCGRYYCALCQYHKGTVVEAAKRLLTFVERIGSLKLIAEAQEACDYEEFTKGLEWLASKTEPCKGCRFGGGWSWWPDCPARNCCIRKGVDFCFECDQFPCRNLQKGTLPEARKSIVDTNKQIEKEGIARWLQILKEKYRP